MNKLKIFIFFFLIVILGGGLIFLEKDVDTKINLDDQNYECRGDVNNSYVVKKSENKYIFSFFDERGVLSKEIMFHSFHSPDEFLTHIKIGMSFNEVVEFDLNYIILPISVVNMQVHILSEGISVIYLDNNNVVTDVRYYDESTYKEMILNNELPGVPYICVDDRKI